MEIMTSDAAGFDLPLNPVSESTGGTFLGRRVLLGLPLVANLRWCWEVNGIVDESRDSQPRDKFPSFSDDEGSFHGCLRFFLDVTL